MADEMGDVPAICRTLALLTREMKEGLMHSIFRKHHASKPSKRLNSDLESHEDATP